MPPKSYRKTLEQFSQAVRLNRITFSYTSNCNWHLSFHHRKTHCLTVSHLTSQLERDHQPRKTTRNSRNDEPGIPPPLGTMQLLTTLLFFRIIASKPRRFEAMIRKKSSVANNCIGPSGLVPTFLVFGEIKRPLVILGTPTKTNM